MRGSREGRSKNAINAGWSQLSCATLEITGKSFPSISTLNLYVSWYWSFLSVCFFFFSSRRRHTRWNCDWSSDVCSSDLAQERGERVGVTLRHGAGDELGLTAVTLGWDDHPSGDRAGDLGAVLLTPDVQGRDRKSVV